MLKKYIKQDHKSTKTTRGASNVTHIQEANTRDPNRPKNYIKCEAQHCKSRRYFDES